MPPVCFCGVTEQSLLFFHDILWLRLACALGRGVGGCAGSEGIDFISLWGDVRKTRSTSSAHVFSSSFLPHRSQSDMSIMSQRITYLFSWIFICLSLGCVRKNSE